MPSSDPPKVRLLSRDSSKAMEEIRQCVGIQKHVGWEPEIVPAHVFRADAIGLMDGAIDLGYILVASSLNSGSEVLSGYARVGYSRDSTVHWLHEIAVSPPLQSRGIGFRLMSAVKERSRLQGGRVLAFTCDPFDAKACGLYLSKCGARAVRVFENFYGAVDTTAHGGGKTHRFLVKWALNATGPNPPQAPSPQQKIPIATTREDLQGLSRVRVEIPRRHQGLEESEALRWEEQALPVLAEALNKREYKATGVRSSRKGNRRFLVLEKDM